uniref:Peroxisomal (S)-2-hydroxy-acid oxidase GLO5 n=1 Tax=Sipha flava TaxID=143950 RepID=A0A2S2Q2K2_9HEMI
MHKLAHEDGELATARAAEKHGSVMILSTLSTCSMEEVVEAAPNAVKWFQLYTYKDKNLTKSLIGRAEKAGFKALVLTVDLPGVHGIRYKNIKNNFILTSHLQ